jgi:uncharacterized membrane protein YdjX (TVP38/TMEM64 family)
MENLKATTSATSARPAGSKWKWAFWVVVIVALIAAGYFFHVQKLLMFIQKLLKIALDWVSGLGVWGPVLFILIYIAACVLFIPGSVLTLGAGALFGVVKGSIYTSIGATLGASAAFLVGRYLARDWIAKKIAGNARFAAIDKAVADEGWKIVGLTRLSPVFPFILLNYAFGLTRVSFRDYFFATWIGTMPGTVMYVYIGSLANAAGKPARTPAQWALYGVGLLATVAVTVVITRIAKKALGRKISIL